MAAWESGLAERQSTATSPTGDVRAHPERRGPALSDLEFPGCYARPMTPAEYEELEGRVEYFDWQAGIAFMAREPAHAPHEGPRERLGQLLQTIAHVRGSPILCLGETEIRYTDPNTGGNHSAHPDQAVYLDPRAREGAGSLYLAARGEPKPDVLLEVDSTTDVRRNRLRRYREWEFPEVWVDVPDACAPSRRGMRSGLRIYLLEAGRYALAEESRAFPTWRAAEIHRGLNERVLSAETTKVLTRVGRALGEREGTGPEDDPLLREQRAEARAEARAEDRAAFVRALFTSRGVAVPASFPSRIERAMLAGVSAEEIVSAATTAESVPDFLSRLADPGS